LFIISFTVLNFDILFIEKGILAKMEKKRVLNNIGFEFGSHKYSG